MKINTIKKISFIALFIYLPIQTMAWGKLGHRIVAQIAESRLNAKSKLAVKAILGNETLAMGSNWADFVRSDKKYDYLNDWHFSDFVADLSDEQVLNRLKADTAVNAYTKINFLVKELKQKTLSQDKKVMYLRLLVHLVGDVHQPLHAGRTEDQGGNRIRVTWFNQSTNLHTIWDSELINHQQLSYTEYAQAINFCSAKQSVIWQHDPASKWVVESYRIAENIYGGVKPDDKLSYRYNYDYIETLNQQLLKGGVRLAGLLNEIFGS